MKLRPVLLKEVCCALFLGLKFNLLLLLDVVVLLPEFGGRDDSEPEVVVQVLQDD